MAFFTGILVLCSFSTVWGLNCYHCRGVTDPHYCAEVIECGLNEECFSDHVIGDFENVFFNSGCRNTNICKLIKDKKTRRNQLAACEECCTTDRCNLGPCTATDNSTSVDCYDCDGIDDPSKCHNKVTCASDEICLAEEYIDGNFQTKFKMACEKKSRCDTLAKFGRRQVTTCVACCSSDGCNKHVC